MNKFCIYIALMLFSSLNTAACKDKSTAVPQTPEPTVPETPKEPETPLPDFFYSYTSGSSTYFNVYQKLTEDGLYTQFKISHQKTTTKNDDLWRVLEGTLVRYNGSAMVLVRQILTTGENEFVWRSARPKVGDFTGGYHGDERIDIDPNSKVTFYADGEAIGAKSNIGLTPCKSFYYHQFSTMHQSGTGAADASKPGYVAIPGNPIDCYHEKKTEFLNNGFTTYNKITWAKEIPIDICYFGIFCVNKDISSEGTNEDGLHVVFDDNGKNKLTSTKQKINMKHEGLGIAIACDAKIIKLPFTPSLETFIWDNGKNNYHKYYSKIQATTVKPGDVWETTASISYSYTK